MSLSLLSRQPAGAATRGACLLLVTALTWVLTHRYAGLTQDGELYAMQAMSRLQPALRGDLYLANTSQDQFTFFSPFYAFLIRQLGLWQAGVALFVVSRIAFFAAAWILIRRLSNSLGAWLSLALLTTVAGAYGAYGVFSFAESYLTARSVAEALVLIAIALVTAGRTSAAWGVIVLSFTMHPLMTLPGALFLICLRLPARRAAAAAIASLCVAGAAVMLATRCHLTGPLQTIDGHWLDVVRQRSQFLFLDEWYWRDWRAHLRSILCLVLVYQVLPDRSIRALCTAAGIVGASGLALAWIAGSIGPVAILLQSQPWRWFWLTSFASIALLGPLALALWRREGVGRFCAVLVIVSWTFPVVEGVWLDGAALLIWASRAGLSPPMLRLLNWAAYALIGVIIVWATGNAWTSITSPLAEESHRNLIPGYVRAVFQTQPIPLVPIALALWWTRSATRSTSVLAAVALGTLLVIFVPGTLAQRSTAGTPKEVRSFQDWQNAIPEDATVLPVPVTVGSMFVWFTLQRAAYLSTDQSAGVVFSRATAEEVMRRSQALRPIMEPDYQIKRRILTGRSREDDRHPLNDESLRLICADSVLGFVIASEELGYPSLLHSAAGAYKGARLYDCRHVREAVTP